ncbi:MAG: hypothetical protein ACN4EP_00835 [Sediminibacterium sp.]
MNKELGWIKVLCAGNEWISTFMPVCPMQEKQVREEQVAAGMFYDIYTYCER